MRYSIWVFLLTINFLMMSFGSVRAQVRYASNLPTIVTPNTTVNTTLHIEGAISNNLANFSQGVCAVHLRFRSPHIWTNKVTLTSPAGQTLTLIGQIENRSSTTQSSVWDIRFVSCNAATAPDAGFTARWRNAQDWAAFTNYRGSYLPTQSCLDSFRTGTVNGDWVLRFQNANPMQADSLLSWGIEFCDTRGLFYTTSYTFLYDTICQGQCKTIAQRTYCRDTTVADTVHLNAFQDSITVSMLSFRRCPVQDNINMTAPSCFGQNNGVAIVQINGGVAPFRVRLHSVDGIVNYQRNNVNSADTIRWLMANNYVVELTDAIGSVWQQTFELTQPNRLSATVTQQKNPTCIDRSDGQINVSTLGGTLPHTLQYWRNQNSVLTQLTQLPAATYQILLRDANGCQDSLNVVLAAPKALRPQLNIRPPRCFDTNDGIISIALPDGGTAPYRFVFQKDTFSNFPKSFSQQPAGQYRISYLDAHNCQADTVFALKNPTELRAELSGATTVMLGDSLSLQASVNVPIERIKQILWQPAAACVRCEMVKFLPLHTMTYRVSVIDTNGCTAQAKHEVRVDAQVPIFVPNAFSPNGDGINDELRVSISEGVDKMLFVRVFNRWGNLISEVRNVENNGTIWNGADSNGVLQKNDVYLLQIIARMINGREEVWSVDVNLLR